MAALGEQQPNHENTISLEQQVINEFLDVQNILYQGDRRFTDTNTHDIDLRNGVRWLRTSQLADFITGASVEDETAQYKFLRKSVDSWTEEESERKLFSFVADEYVRRKDEKVSKMLEGKRLQVATLAGSSHYAIRRYSHHLGGIFPVPNIGEFSGTFFESDVRHGEIALSNCGSLKGSEYLIVKLVDRETPLTPLVKLQVK